MEYGSCISSVDFCEFEEKCFQTGLFHIVDEFELTCTEKTVIVVQLKFIT